MAHVSDLKKLIQRQAFDQEHRTLILIDRVNGGSVWNKFVHRYDDSNRSQIDLYFDSTFRALRTADESVVFTANVLPILSHIGKYQITIIEHTREGCVVKNGDPKEMMNLIGLE
jgi:hypothetical protein